MKPEMNRLLLLTVSAHPRCASYSQCNVTPRNKAFSEPQFFWAFLLSNSLFDLKKLTKNILQGQNQQICTKMQ